ncbi:antigen EG13 [Phlebotomus argentipes]|uniref:antigen EG13 n=1 Tax=Phlebotomus argentipes TaxID=94469 RepID=UPI002893058D|nr:antigen EG13 [Phlebotomus argentipes]
MNKLREFRAKSPQPNRLGGSILNTISRSYSNVSHKFLRRSPGRRGGTHHRAISSGSYDLTGATAEQRLEIGHPILINKTALDVDTIDLRKPENSMAIEMETDSSSEVSCAHLQDITFSFLPEDHEGELAEAAEYEIPPNPKRISPPKSTIVKSKSSTNLHKSELTVYLRRCSSVRLIKHQVSTIEIPQESLNNHVPGRKSLPPDIPPPPPPLIERPEHQYEVAGSHLRRASYSKAVKEQSDSQSGEESAKEASGNFKINLKMPHFNRAKAKNAWSGFRHWLEDEVVVRVRPQEDAKEDTSGGSLEEPSHEPDGHEGQSGFEELRRFVKQGDDFSKEMLAILQERAEAELSYAKSLTKMAIKLNKACREVPASGSWRTVAAEMESRSEIHRQFSGTMSEEIVKPLKVIMENQYKARKAVESTVDKSARILGDFRASENKAKIKCASAAKKNEKLQDTGLDVRIQRSPSLGILHHGNGLPLPTRNPEKEERLTEKEKTKLETKRRKAEEAVKRADMEYYTLCVRAERARVEYEKAVGRGSTVLQTLDTQRRLNMRTYIESFLKLIPFAAEFSLESDSASAEEAPVLDIKNDALIKHFIRPGLNRSKSVVEYGSRSETLPSSGISINGQANGSIAGRGSPIWDRGIADGGSNQHDSDFDEFSSHDEDEDCARKSDKAAPQSKIIGRCKAIYNYAPQLSDELELNPGDIIEIHVKQEDGWWLGALRDRVGIFPATYVEEMS